MVTVTVCPGIGEAGEAVRLKVSVYVDGEMPSPASEK
jgi:hypothetical protein